MKSIDLLAMSACAALAGLTVLLACHQGIGLESDTLSYFAFPSTGDWLKLPVHHGILYPLTLWFFTSAGLGLPHAALAVNLLCAMLLAALVYGCLRKTPGHLTPPWAAAGTLLCSLSLPVLITQSSAMSEPLFLALVFGGVCQLVQAVTDGTRRALVRSAICLALASLTRYAGVAFIMASCLNILLFLRAKPFVRLRTSALYGGLALGPLAVTLLLNRLRSGSGTNRELAFHAVPGDTWREGCSTILSWFLPERLELLLPGLAGVVACALVVLLLASLAQGLRARCAAVGVWSVGICAYAAFLVVSVMWIDVSIMFSQRMLSPLLLLAVPLVFSLGASLHKTPFRMVLAVAVTGYLLAFTSYRAIGFLRQTYHDGTGFASVAWSRSSLVHFVESLQADHTIYSNAADALSLRGATRVVGIPWRLKSTSNRPLVSQEPLYAGMISNLVHRGALLCQLNLRYWPPYLYAEEDIVRAGGLVPLASSADGVLYGAGQSTNAQAVAKQWTEWKAAVAGKPPGTRPQSETR